eukprot:4514950-Pyramimonas_sp.AAC.1
MAKKLNQSWHAAIWLALDQFVEKSKSKSEKLAKAETCKLIQARERSDVRISNLRHWCEENADHA